eukprot:CAMPEP_0197413530 /NCGR_PEP_ID=MMETSP1170-20131217/381_1 /TAXON_ID=54406 /ORGANISM="Sarcinochrysis sp, Strain CCMP770" /LENGTH=131 /DNA_ID=CAMNT_0042940119 /DNA_START=13 /DNA_END=408 /DNA_ORIENTATION=-
MAAAAGPTMVAYGLFLALTGWYGSAATKYATMHSLYSGAGGGAIVAVCGVFSWGPPPAKGDPNYKRWMVFVHLGLVLVGVFGVVFGIQFLRASSNPAKTLQTKLFAAMAAASGVALVGLVRAKPKKKASPA